MHTQVADYLAGLQAAQQADPPELTPQGLRAWYARMGEQAPPAELPPLEEQRRIRIPGGDGDLDALVQVPRERVEGGTVLYFHGGGYCVADAQAVAPMTAQLAHESGCTVVSVDFRMAPEHPYPAAHEDARAALRWAQDAGGGAEVGAEPARIALGGDSSGASLAIAAALEAHEADAPPAALVLFYGWYVLSLDTPTMRDRGPTDPVIPLQLMEMFRAAYAGDSAADDVDYVARSLPALPDTCIIVGEDDPLVSDSELLAEHLREAGTRVEWHSFAGMPHGFSTVPSFTDGRRSVAVGASFARSRVAAR